MLKFISYVFITLFLIEYNLAEASKFGSLCTENFIKSKKSTFKLHLNTKIQFKKYSQIKNDEAEKFSKLPFITVGPNRYHKETLFPDPTSYGSKHYIQINVKTDKYEEYDYIGFSKKYPNNAYDYEKGSFLRSNAWQWVSKLEDGSYETSITVDKTSHHRNDLLTSLDSYYVFYARRNEKGEYEIKSVDGVKQIKNFSNKNWMEENFDNLKNKKLGQIAIPGSHDSGCYSMNVSIDSVQMLSQTQNIDFLTQLNMGVRYFDCRLKYFEGNTVDEFWFNHDSINSIVFLQDLIEQVNKFLINNKKELIILDFSRFKNMDGQSISKEKIYDKFYKRFTPLQKLIVPENKISNESFGNLINNDKRLIFLTDNQDVNEKYNLGNSINLDAEFPNSSNLKEIKTKLDNLIKKKDEYSENTNLWSTQCITRIGWLDSLTGGVETASAGVNSYICKWLEEDLWERKVNVIFADFFLRTNMVNKCIYINKLRK